MTTAAPRRARARTGAPRYRDAWDWISVSDRSVQARVDASRSRAAFQKHMPERTDDPTTHDGYVMYAVSKVDQEDRNRKIRAARHAAKRAKGDPGLRARLAELAGRIAAEHRRAKATAPRAAPSRTGTGEKAESVEAAMAAITDEYERSATRKWPRTSAAERAGTLRSCDSPP